MKRPLAFKLMVDPKNVRRAVALITGDAMTDEELENKYFMRDPVAVDLPEELQLEMTVAMVAFIMAEDMEQKEEIKGKFARKLEEMKNQASNKTASESSPPKR